MKKCPDSRSAATLNAGCACRLIDSAHLAAALDADPLLTGLATEIAQTRPTLFSNTAVFISRADEAAMRCFVADFEAIAHHPRWQADLPMLAKIDHGPLGVFAGFDFHLGENGPQLIEINTNAGGYLLNAILARAQQSCCDAVPASEVATLEAQVLAMFAEEWRSQRGQAPLRTIAILDEKPQEQYLYPEFRLFARLFERAGYQAVIVDPSRLQWRDGQLFCADLAIDLVYNRLTDFYFENQPALRSAYESGTVVVTPNPRAHALYADKRHLARLCDATWLRDMQQDAGQIAALQAVVPATEIVSADNADALWSRRRHLFFKPAAGFGSKAAYRGDKLTRRVWEEILAGEYVAQAFAPPPIRRVPHDDTHLELKFDVRAYAYAGRIQLFAARLYAGQTTNFRTPGGGFAPVFVV
jgi:hypothetical protein